MDDSYSYSILCFNSANSYSTVSAKFLSYYFSVLKKSGTCKFKLSKFRGRKGKRGVRGHPKPTICELGKALHVMPMRFGQVF